MIKKGIIHKFIIVLGLLGVGFSSKATGEIRIAGGIISGTYYPVALQICNMVTRYSPGTKCQVIATTGSINNITLLEGGKVDFALVQSDVAKDANKGLGIFAYQKLNNQLKLVFNLFPEVFSVLVKNKEGLNSFADFSGRKIGLNLNGAGTKNGLLALFKYYKFKQDPRIVHINDSQMSAKLCDEEVDAVIMFTGHPNSMIQKVVNSCNAGFVSIGNIELEHLLAEGVVYDRVTIPTSFYPGITKPANTFATRALLVTNKLVNSMKVKLVSRIISKHFDEFRSSYPVLSGLTKEGLFFDNIISLYQEEQ